MTLLFLCNAQRQKPYCLVTSMSTLLAPLTKHDGARFYCDYCLHRFSEEWIILRRVNTCHLYSLPGFEWNVMLKMIGIRLKVLMDIEINTCSLSHMCV